MPDSQHSLNEVLSRLRTELRGVKLLALGQTVYWDEPVKAILRRILDEHCPDAEMLVGIHDADYFSKISASLKLPTSWAILPHTDGVTRDLWVATGEISSLFGSETIPTRDMLTGHGVQFDKIAKSYPGGREALIETATEAWGWRGLVHADSATEIAAGIPLRDALPHLIELLDWGFSHTLDMLSEVDAARGRYEADQLLSEVREYAESHPDAAITDMFREFLGRFYVRLLGRRPPNLELTSTTELFRFDRSTAGLPRFDLLRAFLDPRTRSKCQEAYDLAVQGSDTYTLDRFCVGAIPFDLVIPGRGRGTICLREGAVAVDAEEPIILAVDFDPTTPEELAALVEENLGPGTALVGKALTLVLMMASEFIFVLHEQASAYVPRCEKMADLMKQRGVALKFHPILRIAHHTWDSLSACDATFNLPGHLAAAFGQGEITSTEFADSWRATAHEQELLLGRLSRLMDTDQLLAFLAEHQGEPWPERIQAYMDAYAAVRELTNRAEPMKEESVRLRDLGHRIKQEIQQLEVEKGVHFRERVKPPRDEIDRLDLESGNASEIARLKDELRMQEDARAESEARISRKREEANDAHNRSLALKHEVRSIERGGEMVEARDALSLIEYEAELARLWLVRDAILVSKGLTYANHRPSAWWFLLADPELKWFDRLAETVELRFEEIESRNG